MKTKAKKNIFYWAGFKVQNIFKVQTFLWFLVAKVFNTISDFKILRKTVYQLVEGCSNIKNYVVKNTLLFLQVVVRDEKIGKCYICEVKSCEGEATINNRKQKIICFYEFKLICKWKGTLEGRKILRNIVISRTFTSSG